MVRAKELSGRAVVDIDAAEKLGRIAKVILDPDARRVAGFVVARGGSVFGDSSTHTTVPASAVHAVGPDAVTVHQSAGDAAAELDRLPSAGDLIGRKVVSTEGRFLGIVGDVLISGADGRIVGYELGSGDPLSKLGDLFSEKRRRAAYLRADANLRPGRDLIVAPESAITDAADDSPAPAPPTTTVMPTPHSRSWFRADGAAAPRWEDPEP